MKKHRHTQRIEDNAELQMTSMIDIVFQLLIFFLLSAKFVALEGQLNSYLPKDRGLESTVTPPPLAQASLFLIWEDPGDVKCATIQYVSPDDGTTRRTQYYFPNKEPGQVLPFGPEDLGEKVRYQYSAPDFQEIERYIRFRHENYAELGGLGKGLPVTVTFDDKVPVQMVVNLLDICTRVGITDFTLAAKEEAEP